MRMTSAFSMSACRFDRGVGEREVLLEWVQDGLDFVGVVPDEPQRSSGSLPGPAGDDLPGDPVRGRGGVQFVGDTVVTWPCRILMSGPVE